MKALTRWQKSSYSSEGNNCVEIASGTDGTLHLRESDDPTTVLVTTPARARVLLTLTAVRPPLI
jgi:hypothetical protein